jgi:hypothetical protein
VLAEVMGTGIRFRGASLMDKHRLELFSDGGHAIDIDLEDCH